MALSRHRNDEAPKEATFEASISTNLIGKY
nr:MAG TPA: hypothetical protein [Caudoviricetes sp.]